MFHWFTHAFVWRRAFLHTADRWHHMVILEIAFASTVFVVNALMTHQSLIWYSGQIPFIFFPVWLYAPWYRSRIRRWLHVQ